MVHKGNTSASAPLKLTPSSSQCFWFLVRFELFVAFLFYFLFPFFFTIMAGFSSHFSIFFRALNPQKYTQSHTTTIVQGGGERRRGWWWSPYLISMHWLESEIVEIFLYISHMIEYSTIFRKNFNLSGKPLRYILWVLALLEAWTSPNMVAILPAILDFTQN